MAGLTATGFVRKTFVEIENDIKEELWRSIDPNLVLTDKTALGQIIDAFSNKLAETWEALEEAYYAYDPDNATGLQVVALSRLTGTKRRLPTQGVVPVTVNLDGGSTYLAGSLVAHEDGRSANRWYNLNDITTPTGAAADYAVTFVSEAFGSNTELASGTLTEIAETAVGWNSVTNTSDATPGEDEEQIEELRQRRENELAAVGSTTLRALVADVSALDGVLDVVGFENVTSATVGSLPPHSFRIVVWDGATPAVANNAIAQRIHDTRPCGIPSYGTVSGTATAYNGALVTESFDRATQKEVEITITIASATGVAIADVRAAILTAFGLTNAAVTEARKQIGDDVIYNATIGAAFSVAGVDDVSDFQIRFSGDAWGTSNLSVGTDEIATLALADIEVLGAAS